MKKDKNVTKAKTIDQFQFQIIPVSISFSKKQSNKFFLYVQKGAQVLGKVNQLISGQQDIHKFMDNHNKRFRIANDKNLTYQWSIYRYTSDEQEEYMQSSNFNIKNAYQAYVGQIQGMQAYLYRIYGEKDKKCEIEQIWKDLRHDLTKNEFQMSCTFPKLNAKVIFKMRIRCELDFRYQMWEEAKEKKRLARNVNSSRKISMDYKNMVTEPPSFLQVKEKYSSQQPPSSPQQLFIKPVMIKQPEVSNDNKIIQQKDEVRQSQIRITDPQGMDVTTESPQKSMKPTHDDDYYYRKKSSMLSDIIEESYEGSSNVFTKSNQGEKLQSVDQIHQEEEPLFSPLIKTQAYDSHKDQDYTDAIKRTATLFQKSSQQFDLQQSPKAGVKKTSQYFPNVQHRNQQSTTQLKSDPFLLQTRSKISRKNSQSKEHQSQVVLDINEAKKQTIKNVIKIIIIVVVLIVVINSLSLFDHNNKKLNHQNKKKTKKSTQK